MPKNEDGEFELILANRQLLSVFFIVVVLLGVFFTMGYIVGRNSAPAQVDVASTHKAEQKPMVVESPAPAAQTAPAENPAPSATQPQQPPAQEAKAEPKAEAEVKKEPPAKKESKKEREAKAREAKTEKSAPVSASPQAGQTYLQLVATAKAEADVMVDVLHQKKFKAVAAEIPEKPGLYRVLVGPLADGTVSKTKADLTASGFPGDKAIKKVF
ncbi:MAG TPA: SPOR domain-containing protein [Bryobacteraceae bacterium]|nr:SPOR domain-containing protein [Bryobacteraceae bacterium]